jgi:hypothetical protein
VVQYAVPPCCSRITPRLHSGVLAYAIGKMDGVGGKRGWQWWIFFASRCIHFRLTILCQDFHSRGAVDHCDVIRGYFSRPDMATESQMGMGDGFKRTLLYHSRFRS